jgi:Ca-activated chloride channel family protein
MNNDEHDKDMRDQVSGDMEARIVAWVSGEASAEESAELGRLVAGNAALAALKARIEVAAKLAAEATAADPKPLRMSEARRAALLREIGTKAKAVEAHDVAADVPALVVLQRKQRRERRWMLAVAACLTTGLFLSMMIPSFQKVNRGAAQREAMPAAYMARPEAKALPEKGEAADFDELAEKKEEVSLAAPRIEVPVEMPAAPSTGSGGRVAGVENPRENAGAYGAVLNNARQLEAAPVRYYGARRAEAAPGEPAGADSEAPIALSPFVVNEAQDKGTYTANSTLAGTRVRTDLKDVASSISVATSQFLQDVPSAIVRDGASYSPNPKGAAVSAALLDREAATVSSFAADALQNGQSDELSDATKVPELQAPVNTSLLKGPLYVSIPWDSAGKGIAGTGSPSVMPASVPIADDKAPAQDGFGGMIATREPVSTFSLHVSDVSFRLAQAALARGEAPDPAQVRPEEFYNAFDYGDPVPAMSETIACHTEQSVDPVMQQRNLLRIAMRVPTTGHGANQPLRLTVLLDTSGSMEREDRAVAVASAMKVLVSLLGRDDRVTLVGFARSPRLLAEQVHGDKAGSLLDIIAKTPPDGGTNLEEAIKLGSELAQRQFMVGAQNRIVLLTDGAANLGDADPAHLAALVESLRQRSIAFDACGVGSAGINDSVLEALTRKGSGRYYVLDSPAAADEAFARQIAGAFRPAAENVKVQVRFNPSRVGHYRLIGFEKHRLNKEDFRNDTVAAAALAGGEAAVALYEVEALPQGEGDLGEVYVRFHDTASGRMVERSWLLPYDPYAPAFDKATPSLQLAGTAALLAEKLRGGARADAINLAQLAPVVNALRTHYSHEAPVQELAAMYQQMRRMRGE